MANVVLVSGGARSGKSGYAQQLCEKISPSPIYVATAQSWDGDFEERIKRHQSDRGEQWTTVEETIEISKHAEAFKTKAVMVDCLTLWLTNFFVKEGAFNLPKDGEEASAGSDSSAADRALAAAKAEFDKLVSQWDTTLVFVTNEIGSGTHPDGAMSRKFVDAMGWLNQHAGNRAQRVVHMVCGQANVIKAPPPPGGGGRGGGGRGGVSAERAAEAQLLDSLLSARSMPMEPKGYFILGLDREAGLLTANFHSCMLNDQGKVCDLDGNIIPCDDDGCGGYKQPPPLKKFTARTAKEMTVEIFERWDGCPVVSVVHAAYVGREMQRAEQALFSGQDYQQD